MIEFNKQYEDVTQVTFLKAGPMKSIFKELLVNVWTLRSHEHEWGFSINSFFDNFSLDNCKQSLPFVVHAYRKIDMN